MRNLPRALLTAALLLLLTAGCRKPASGPLPRRAYLWQRDWTPAVSAAADEGARRLDGIVVLGAQIDWVEGKPRTVWASVNWPRLKASGKPCAFGLRVAPWAGPFQADDAAARAIADTLRTLLRRAQEAGVTPAEVQLDFDCAQKKLPGYRTWLRALRPAVQPVRLVITALPSWLGEPALPGLLAETDGWVLQVHSVPTRAQTGRAVLCDPGLARQWVQAAAKLRRPFSVALPTYRCTAGFEPGSGRLLGMAMDSIPPRWPPGTRTLKLAADADALAGLVREWQAARPPELRELLWYRLPVATDARNWSWTTLAPVMDGRAPRHALEPSATPGELADLTLTNRGEAEEQPAQPLIVTWSGPPAIAGDALAGWQLALEPERAVFHPEPGHEPRLLPGAKCSVGWLRYARPPSLHLALAPAGSEPPADRTGDR